VDAPSARGEEIDCNITSKTPKIEGEDCLPGLTRGRYTKNATEERMRHDIPYNGACVKD
jgi:hypothetical protein